MQIEQDRLGRLSRKQTRQHEHTYGMRTGQVEQAEQKQTRHILIALLAEDESKSKSK